MKTRAKNRDNSVTGEGDYAFKRYLRDMGESSLLTPSQELALAKRVRGGDDAAREEMIKANLRLVVKIAKDNDGFGVPLLDMINEGNIGLMRAVERFDPRKGKFSTYAGILIKRAITGYIARRGRTIRLPVNLVHKVNKISRASAKLYAELGREPSVDEISCEMGMKPKRFARLIIMNLKPRSLDAPIGEDGDTRLLDITKDESARTAYDELERKTRLELIEELLEGLDELELKIIRGRFGLISGRKKTLKQMERQFASIGSKRIHQIEKTALRKLRKQIEKREAIRDPELNKILAN